MNTTNDLTRLRAAFADFRARGFWARQSQEDGWPAVPEDRIQSMGKIVFWHANETHVAIGADGNLRAPLHLRHFRRDSDEIVAVLKEHGLRCTIDRSALGGVVLFPTSRIALGASTQLTGTRYRMEFAGEAMEFIVSNENDQFIELIATTVSDLNIVMPVKLFAQRLVAESIVSGGAAPVVPS